MHGSNQERLRQMAATILYVHGIGEIGGAERELLFILSSLDRTLFHPVVLCPPDSPLAERVEALGIPVHGMHFPAWRKLNHMFAIPGAVCRIMAVLRSCRPCLVHVNDYWWGPLCYLANRAARLRVPILLHIRQEVQGKRIRQYWFRKFDRILVVSGKIKTVLGGSGLRSDTIDVLHSGIDVDVFCRQARRHVIRDRYGVQPHQAVIGTVASIFPRKGHECFIHAMDHLQQVFPDCRCFIVGKGNEAYLMKLRQLVQSRNLQRHMTFTGFQENVADFLEAFDVFVLSSRLEGFGIVLLEAMAMKKPVVATRVGGVPEVVEAGVTGYLVPPDNAHELALAIQDLLKDSATRKRMGEEGKKRVERLFTKRRVMHQLEEVYKQFAGSSLPGEQNGL